VKNYVTAILSNIENVDPEKGISRFVVKMGPEQEVVFEMMGTASEILCGLPGVFVDQLKLEPYSVCQVGSSFVFFLKSLNGFVGLVGPNGQPLR
jgi:hypothetical protein